MARRVRRIGRFTASTVGGGRSCRICSDKDRTGLRRVVGAQEFEIREILLAAAGSLVPDERRAVQDRDAHSLDFSFDASAPGFFERMKSDLTPILWLSPALVKKPPSTNSLLVPRSGFTTWPGIWWLRSEERRVGKE